MKYRELDFKDKIKMIIALVSFISAIIIGFWAMLIPPEGEISSSVLFFVAQLLVFVTTLLGLNLTIDGKNYYVSNQEKHKENEREEE